MLAMPNAFNFGLDRDNLLTEGLALIPHEALSNAVMSCAQSYVQNESNISL